MIMMVAVGVLLIILLVVATLLFRRFRKPVLRQDRYAERWAELQKNCAQRTTWPQAIIEADELLDDALKRCHYKGRTTGERLVSAQRSFTNNENVWFGHKYRTKVTGEDVRKLKKSDILYALGGFRQALRDLGALRNDK